MTRDGRLVLAAQGVRAFVYGFASVLLGVTLDAQGWSTTKVGVLLTAILAGTGLLSVVVGRYSERIGRRQLYFFLFLGLATSGLAFSLTTNVVVLVAVALTGTLSTEVVESGPFTSLEQAMLPDTVPAARRTRVFGTYNAVATIAGSFGALAAGGPALLRDAGVGVPADQRFFLVLVPVGLAGAVIAARLSATVEVDRAAGRVPGPLRRSRPVVARLAGLFALDSFGGGFAVQSFLVFFLSKEFDVSADALGAVFFAVGFLQAASFVAATLLAERVGLLNTMVFTHLPSNLLLAAVPFAPNATVAVVLVLARFALSQMDVPTRQAYVVALVEPGERVAAAAYTATARYAVRPVAPVVGGALQQVSLGLPLVLAGGIKVVYDLVLWSWFRRVPLPTHNQRRWSMIACLRTVRVPADERGRFLTWIDENAELRRRHGILAELVLVRSARQNPSNTLRPDDVYADPEEYVVITAWPDHDTFDAWIDTPDRDRLTSSPTHEAVQFGPLTRYDVIGGYLADALAAIDPTGDRK